MSEPLTKLDKSFIYPEKFFKRESDLKDSASQRNHNAFYTPYPVVDFMNRAVQDILKDVFGLKHGVVNENVKVLDFAAGTGIFICDLIEKAFKEKEDIQTIYKIIQDNFYAYEIDSETYQVLLENITAIFKCYGFEFDSKNIHNINTLSDEGFHLFNGEHNES